MGETFLPETKKNKTSTWTPTNPNLKKDGSAASPNLPDFGMAGFAKTAKLKKKQLNNGGALPDKRFRPERSKALMTWLASGILQDHDRWFDVMCMFVFEWRIEKMNLKKRFGGFFNSYIMQTKTKTFLIRPLFLVLEFHIRKKILWRFTAPRLSLGSTQSHSAAWFTCYTKNTTLPEQKNIPLTGNLVMLASPDNLYERDF